MQQHEPWWREFTQEEYDRTWRQLKNYSNEFARRRAFRNQICLNQFLALLTELGKQSVQLPSPDELAIFWEFVNGTPIELNKSRLLLLPCETGEIDYLEFRVPQEWVYIPKWVADYYLPVWVNLDEYLQEYFIVLQGIISYPQLKMQSIDLRDRTYLGEDNDLEVIEEEMIDILQRNLFWPIIKKFNIFPNQSPEEERRLLDKLGNPSIQNPRLNSPSEQWMALVAKDECLKQLYHRRIEAPTVLSWRERLEKIFDETWQTVAEIIDIIGTPEPSLASEFRFDDQLKEERILELIDILSTSKDKLTRLDAIEWLGRNAQGKQDAIACLQDVLKSSEDPDIRREAAVSLGKIDPGNEQAGIRKAKIINLGPMDQVALAVTLTPVSDREKMQFHLQVNSVGPEFLPRNLEMSILDEEGKIFSEIQSRKNDDAMQLVVTGEEGDRFTVKLALGYDAFREEFVL